MGEEWLFKARRWRKRRKKVGEAGMRWRWGGDGGGGDGEGEIGGGVAEGNRRFERVLRSAIWEERKGVESRERIVERESPVVKMVARGKGIYSSPSLEEERERERGNLFLKNRENLHFYVYLFIGKFTIYPRISAESAPRFM